MKKSTPLEKRLKALHLEARRLEAQAERLHDRKRRLTTVCATLTLKAMGLKIGNAYWVIPGAGKPFRARLDRVSYHLYTSRDASIGQNAVGMHWTKIDRAGRTLSQFWIYGSTNAQFIELDQVTLKRIDEKPTTDRKSGGKN